VIGRLIQLTFSIDGWPEQHNLTRKSLNPEIDPFITVYRNLCNTTEAFPDLDVSVQGSVINDENRDPRNALRYFTLMLAAGVKRNKISLGPSAATLRRNAIRPYLETISTSTRTAPCCDHLTHKGFYIYNNHIYGSYHRLEEFPPIAHLDDSVEDTLLAKRNYITKTMPMLRDSICMNECNAVGVCWGLCTSARHIFVGQKPSSVCDRKFKEAKLLEIVQRIGQSENIQSD
jgi:sulfatase maturation enzyme AslB (radical SAM superfamily)